MNSLRLLMVTPRYWPLVGDTERVTSRLANEFCSRGCATTILTARWHHDWPESVVHRQAVVKRLPGSPRGGWTTLRYMRALARWVRQHREEFDIVYVMNLRQDAYAVVGALGGHAPPVVLRAQKTRPPSWLRPKFVRTSCYAPATRPSTRSPTGPRKWSLEARHRVFTLAWRWPMRMKSSKSPSLLRSRFASTALPKDADWQN
ncbi:MAG: glycosyltransferase [Planctomycetia bacterium]|nr:glycosyltransferase [Planctomycetia bacterium]